MTSPADRSNLPENNQKAAKILYALEVGLRELIIYELSHIHGERWHTTLPSDITQKITNGLQAERASTWTTYVNHHPIYYIDFPDLRKVIIKNWTQVFKPLLGDQDVFSGDLKGLEPIRNKLAHNRKVTDEDCGILAAMLNKLQTAIGQERLTKLVSQGTEADSITEGLKSLVSEIDNAQKIMNSQQEATPLLYWNKTKNTWWFESQFLTASNNAGKLELAESKLNGMEEALMKQREHVEKLRQIADKLPKPSTSELLDPVHRFFDLYAEYQLNPRTRGCGHLLEEWCKTHSISDIAEEAANNLNSILITANE